MCESKRRRYSEAGVQGRAIILGARVRSAERIMNKWMQFISQLGLVLLLTASSHAESYPNTSRFGGDVDTTAEWYRQCMEVKDVEVPTNEKPLPATESFSVGCSTSQYYIVKGSAPTEREWSDVLSCARQSRNMEVLMMLYANGFGVQKNSRIALHYACQVPGAPAEVESRVSRLVARIASDDSGVAAKDSAIFDLCDDVTSGYLGGYCAQYHLEENEAEVQRWKKKYLEKLSPAARVRLVELEQATREFAERRAAAEISPMGTGYATFLLGAKSEVIEQLFRDLKAFDEQGDLTLSVASFSDSDAKLNRIYRVIMSIDDSNGTSSLDSLRLSKTSIRDSQRAWIRYRDAWLAFMKVQYPEVSGEKWAAALTKRRTEQLRPLARL